ncbi:protein phosphatase 2C domain-containing protein [Deinococcus marmoris]|uniref:protein phosphatase 2C domain-containing protein n=1 Tax=Deinococcus marmoris TaxID=249408 RepID=UPI00068B026F|nr:protein phosphatase 2C domain-containing protein [Deinococcus marmoris]
MTQPDDAPHDLAAAEQVRQPETQPPEPLVALLPPIESALPLETKTLDDLTDKQHADDLLDVDYAFPSPPDIGGVDSAAFEATTSEVLESPDAGEGPVDIPDADDSDSAAGLENPLGEDGPAAPESSTPSNSSVSLDRDVGTAPVSTTDSLIDEAQSAVTEPLSGLERGFEVAPTDGLSDRSSFVTGELEEETYAPTVALQGPQAGEVVSGYQLNQDLGRGWFSANALGAGPSVDVYVRPQPLWAELRPHRLLPRVTQVGDLWVLAPTEGTPLTLPLDSATARAYLTDLARLLFALEKQGYAVIDLDPLSVQLTREGVKLRLPPQVARLGEAAQPTLRDNFTPPEVQEGQLADAKSGVYLLGALFFQWLTGRPLPTDGPSSIVLAGVNASGVPQLLSGMLAPLPQRLTPTELLAALRAASARLPVYQLAAATDIGLNPERPTNEDAYGFVWHQTGQHGGGAVTLRAVVSDGMGGMAAGEVASQAAVRAFLGSEAPTLEAQVWEANAAVLADMQGRDGGCTLTGIEICGTQLQLGHVGDTRAYLAQGGAVQQLSKDHSYVAAMVASGQMTPEEAQVSPERNKVLRSLGSLRAAQDNYVQVFPEPLEVPVGSRVLLISDGVWGEVLPDVLHDLLLHEPSLQGVVDRLIELSLASGAPDNATALVIERVR